MTSTTFFNNKFNQEEQENFGWLVSQMLMIDLNILKEEHRLLIIQQVEQIQDAQSLEDFAKLYYLIKQEFQETRKLPTFVKPHFKDYLKLINN
jgi:hypothetical protein